MNMRRTSFWILLWARFLQIVGFGLAFYGVFIASISQAFGENLTVWLIPLIGIALFTWGSKILYDRGMNILPH